jgi:hypothetical protein
MKTEPNEHERRMKRGGLAHARARTVVLVRGGDDVGFGLLSVAVGCGAASAARRA